MHKRANMVGLLAMGLASSAHGGEVLVHMGGSIIDQGLTLWSAGYAPKPSLKVNSMSPARFEGASWLSNLEAYGDMQRPWHAYADYVEQTRGGNGLVVKHPLLFGMFPLTVGIPVDYGMSLRTALLGAGYRLGGGQQADWGVTLGVRHDEVSLSLRPSADAGMGEQTASARLTTPAVGGFLHYRSHARWTVHARLNGISFRKRMDDGEKSVQSLQMRLGIDWRLFENVAIGVACQTAALRYTVARYEYHSEYGYSTRAVTTYLKATF